MQKQVTPNYGEKIALAAGSLSTLALLPGGAAASIIYTTGSPVNMSLSDPTGTYAAWDVDGPGGFGPAGRLVKSAGPGFPAVFFRSEEPGYNNGRGFIGSTSTASGVRPVASGFIVGNTLAAYAWAGAAGLAGRNLLYDMGSGPKAATGFIANDQFLGFKFTDGSNLFYGWSKWNINLVAGTVTITEWAYNDTPDGAIAVGDTGAAAAVPEPGTLSLALLGMGAGGLRAWRKRRQARAMAA